LRTMFSPGFKFTGTRGVSVLGSGLDALKRLPEFRQSLRLLDEVVEATKPDLIINFLEPVTGVYRRLGRCKVPVLVVGHQFMLEHPEFPRQRHAPLQQMGFRNFVRLVSGGAAKLALSFYPASDLPRRRLYVCPPILRRQLFELSDVKRGDYLLVYLLNHGYAGDIERWCADNPAVPVHCFYDKPGAPETASPRPGLTFHRLHGEKFLQLMSGCRGVVCTAGFESVSEAAYLGKPVLMIPVQNHIEQFLNSLDAAQAGLGLADTQFNLSRLLAPDAPCGNDPFRDWVNQAETVAMRVAETVASDKK